MPNHEFPKLPITPATEDDVRISLSPVPVLDPHAPVGELPLNALFHADDTTRTTLEAVFVLRHNQVIVVGIGFVDSRGTDVKARLVRAIATYGIIDGDVGELLIRFKASSI